MSTGAASHTALPIKLAIFELGPLEELSSTTREPWFHSRHSNHVILGLSIRLGTELTRSIYLGSTTSHDHHRHFLQLPRSRTVPLQSPPSNVNPSAYRRSSSLHPCHSFRYVSKLSATSCLPQGRRGERIRRRRKLLAERNSLLLETGSDCIGSAQTGSGKTVAFAIPIMQALAKDPNGLFAVVLTPTR